MDYKNYIFDFGNVLYMFYPKDIIAKYTDNEDEIQTLHDLMFDDWAKLDKGLIDYEKYIEDIYQKAPTSLKDTAKTILKTWHRALPQVNGTFDIIKKLKEKGKKLYLLSNAPRILSDTIHTFPEYEYFDGIVISGCVKMVKPDREIYEYILDKFNLKIEETFFIDDRQANVEGAQSMGIKSYLFKNDALELAKVIL